MPASTSTDALVNVFSNFFSQKIADIRRELDNESGPITTYVSLTSPVLSRLDKFDKVSVDYISKLVMKAPSKSCVLDAIPTHLLKDCLSVLAPFLTELVNQSLEQGQFPSLFKLAAITPLLKKPELDSSFNNYRPISNLTFLSKLIERVVSNQLVRYLKDNKLCEPLQSAYRAFHSTETALVKIQNDILQFMDNNKTVLLVLLDLSAAFETIDFGILLNRLEHMFGLSGTVLCWMKSYLVGRFQRVHLRQRKSEAEPLRWGVPQGSVLCPLLFSLYLTPLGDIVRSHDINFHMYADDIQLYLSTDPSQFASARSSLERCILDVRAWMSANKLKLNDSKTEFLVLGRKLHLENTSNSCLIIGNKVIHASPKVRNLGTTFDPTLSMDSYISSLCRSSYFHLRNLSLARKYLHEKAIQSLVHAAISTRIDYCNSLLYGIPNKYLKKLQMLQNSAARIVKQIKKTDHITPILAELHWLPVTFRIKYKLLLFAFKVYHDTAPQYLSELLHPYVPRRNLRSSDAFLLETPHSHLVSCGDRSFSVSAPRLWNDLPYYLRSCDSLPRFKKLLKTLFFRECFSDIIS